MTLTQAAAIPNHVEVEAEARALLVQHGLESQGWRFVYDRALTRSGSCDYSRRLITLSRLLIGKWSRAEVRDTLLHEIAHAMAGPTAGHGPVWKATALGIGCSAQVCHTHHFTRPKYSVVCSCGRTRLARYRVTHRLISKRICSHCNGPKRYVNLL